MIKVLVCRYLQTLPDRETPAHFMKRLTLVNNTKGWHIVLSMRQLC